MTAPTRENQNECAPPPPLPDPSGASTSAPQQTTEYNAYNFVTDKVGFVPNTRKSDNVLQAKIFLATWAACILIGALWGKVDGALTGLFLGIVMALLVSGGVLTIIGLKRKS